MSGNDEQPPKRERGERGNPRSRSRARGQNRTLSPESIARVSAVIGSFSTLERRLQAYALPILSRIVGSEPARQAAPAPAQAGAAPAPNRPVATTPRVRGYDRPIIHHLAYATWLRTASAELRTSEEGRSNQRLLSAAIAASNRGRITGHSDEEILISLQEAGDDLTLIRTLYEISHAEDAASRSRKRPKSGDAEASAPDKPPKGGPPEGGSEPDNDNSNMEL